MGRDLETVKEQVYKANLVIQILQKRIGELEGNNALLRVENEMHLRYIGKMKEDSDNIVEKEGE